MVRRADTPRRVKSLAKRRRFEPRDHLAGMISEAKQMWGRPVIKASAVEANPEDVATPENRPANAEDMEEEHTPITPSAERMGTPPLPEAYQEAEHETTRRASPVLAQTEPNHLHVSSEEVERDIPQDEDAVRPEAPLNAEVQTRRETSLGPSTYEPRPSASEVDPNAKATLNTEGTNGSRFRSVFEILGRGLLGSSIEAIKNLIPEGFLGNAGAASLERIAQGIMISHYQVKFLESLNYLLRKFLHQLGFYFDLFFPLIL